LEKKKRVETVGNVGCLSVEGGRSKVRESLPVRLSGSKSVSRELRKRKKTNLRGGGGLYGSAPEIKEGVHQKLSGVTERGAGRGRFQGSNMSKRHSRGEKPNILCQEISTTHIEEQARGKRKPKGRKKGKRRILGVFPKKSHTSGGQLKPT